MKFRKKKQSFEYRDADLNIMPFIDVFSVLNVFLLFSAVFVSLGVVRVQIPFLSNAQPDEPPTRSLTVNVSVFDGQIELTTRYSQAPFNEESVRFPLNVTGIQELHNALVAKRLEHPETDLVTLFTDDDVLYDQFITITDAIKIRQEGDPVIISEQEAGDQVLTSENYVYPKVVIGSVIL